MRPASSESGGQGLGRPGDWARVEGRGQRAAGGGRQRAGRRQAAGRRQSWRKARKAASRPQKASSRPQEAGSRRLKTGGNRRREQEAGSRQQQKANSRQRGTAEAGASSRRQRLPSGNAYNILLSRISSRPCCDPSAGDAAAELRGYSRLRRPAQSGRPARCAVVIPGLRAQPAARRQTSACNAVQMSVANRWVCAGTGEGKGPWYRTAKEENWAVKGVRTAATTLGKRRRPAGGPRPAMNPAVHAHRKSCLAGDRPLLVRAALTPHWRHAHSRRDMAGGGCPGRRGLSWPASWRPLD